MTDPAPKPKRRWIPILLGVVILLCFIGIGAVVFTAVWVREHLQVTGASEAAATVAFDDVKAKFAGQQPLLELRDGRPQYPAERGTVAPSTTRLTTLRILAFDPNDGRLARFEVPFWFLRLKSGPIAFSSYASALDGRGVNLRVEDIENHGPGIVIDFNRSGDGRVLVWAE